MAASDNLNARLAMFRHVAVKSLDGYWFCKVCASLLEGPPEAVTPYYLVEAPDRPELPRDRCKVASYPHPGLTG